MNGVVPQPGEGDGQHLMAIPQPQGVWVPGSLWCFSSSLRLHFPRRMSELGETSKVPPSLEVSVLGCERGGQVAQPGPEGGTGGVRQGLHKDTHTTVRAVLPLGRLPRGQAGRRGERTMAGGVQAGVLWERTPQYLEFERHSSRGQSQLQLQLCDLGQVGSALRLPEHLI